ncbi:MAG TPA: LysR family transcriptional regulator [Rhizobiales bacterium]|nr:LysR family transcriptional regulator [Hyphomicrobiales bacterium]
MPSLNTLRAFEAVARLNSISVAANELCVTPAAVAQHVKSLEAWTGSKLLQRHPRAVELTPLGQSVLEEFTMAFDQLGRAVQNLRTSAAPFEVRIAALPSIAQLWLSPRLPEIRSTLPNVSISVSALEHCPNLTRDSFDLAIFYQDSKHCDDCIVVGQDRVFPVASPTVAKRLTKISDLSSETFLYDMSWKADWETWLDNVVPCQNLKKSGPEFTLYSLALEECKNGAGVLIGHEYLVRTHLADGKLAAPFNEMVSLDKYLTIHTQRKIKPDSPLETIVQMLADSP